MPVWQLVVIQVATFAALLLALRALFSRNLNRALKRLQTLHEETMVKEAQLKEELQRAQQERAAEVERGRQEAAAVLDAAKREAQAVRANAETQAKQESQRIVARGREELERLRAHLASEIENDALHLSTEMIRYTFTEDGKAEFHRHLIDGLITEISRLEKDRFSVHAEMASVTSSFPLTDHEKQRLRRVLSEKLGGDVGLTEHLDPELITGLVVQIGGLVIDGSLKNKLRKAIPFLRDHKAADDQPTGADSQP